MTEKERKELIGKRSRLYRKLFKMRDILPGALSERKVCCGHANCICRRVGAISDDTLKYGLAHLCPESLQSLWHMLSKRTKRNGMLRNSPFCDYIVGLMDCIEIYNSYNVECDHCLTRRIETTEGDKIQYYHRAVVLTIVGFDFPIPVGLEMMKPGEDEVSCGLRLLNRLVSHLGKRFFDILIGDAKVGVRYSIQLSV